MGAGDGIGGMHVWFMIMTFFAEANEPPGLVWIGDVN